MSFWQSTSPLSSRQWRPRDWSPSYTWDHHTLHFCSAAECHCPHRQWSCTLDRTHGWRTSSHHHSISQGHRQWKRICHERKSLLSWHFASSSHTWRSVRKILLLEHIANYLQKTQFDLLCSHRGEHFPLWRLCWWECKCRRQRQFRQICSRCPHHKTEVAAHLGQTCRQSSCPWWGRRSLGRSKMQTSCGKTNLC